MRITNQMAVGQFMQSLNSNLARLNGYNQQLSTGKRFQTPSDDPVGVGRSLQLKTSLTETDQYAKNVDSATSWLDAADSALGDVTTVMQRAKEIAVSGSNSALDQTARDALATETDQLLQQVVNVANQDHAGRYLFGGFQTTTQPFTTVGTPITAVNYNGDAGQIRYDVSNGVKAEVNVPGGPVFNQVFTALINLRDNLTAGNATAISSTSIAQVDSSVDNLLTWRSEVGARTNQLQLTSQRLEELKTNFTKLLSDNEDIDVAETIMNMKQQENVYQAALSTGARIIQPTLLDFLK